MHAWIFFCNYHAGSVVHECCFLVLFVCAMIMNTLSGRQAFHFGTKSRVNRDGKTYNAMH